MATKATKQPRPRRTPAPAKRQIGHDVKGRRIVRGCIVMFTDCLDTGLVTHIEEDALMYRVIGCGDDGYAESMIGRAGSQDCDNALLVADKAAAARLLTQLASIANDGCPGPLLGKLARSN